jgi:hypothetical protein
MPVEHGATDVVICVVSFGESALPSYLRPTLVQARADEIRLEIGERAPFATRVEVKAGVSSDAVVVEAAGPHAAAVCAALPEQVRIFLSSTDFDSDGFVLQPRSSPDTVEGGGRGGGYAEGSPVSNDTR